MNFWQWIENAREKPEKERRQIALLTSASVTLVIALVWISTVYLLPATMSGDSAAVAVASPFSLVVTETKNFWQNITKGFDAVREATNDGARALQDNLRKEQTQIYITPGAPTENSNPASPTF